MPGTGVTALTETVELTRHALSLGVTRVMMLPPFYYKGLSDDALFASYAEIAERVGDARLRVVLYHIPQFSAVPITFPVIERLRARYPSTFVGIKDSSGDFDNMTALVERFPGLSVLAGADPLMLPLLRKGGAGCITASGNVNVPGIRRLYDNWRGPQAEALQAEVTRLRTTLQAYPMIPALKAIVAHYHNDPDWAMVRPPLVALDRAQTAALIADLDKLGFTLGERPQAKAA